MSPIFVHSQIRESKTYEHLDKPPPSLQQLAMAITLYEFVTGFIITCKSAWFWQSLKGDNSIFFYVKGLQTINLSSWGSMETLMQRSPFNPAIRYSMNKSSSSRGRYVSAGNLVHFCEIESNPTHCQDPCFMKKWSDENDASLWHTSPWEAWYLQLFMNSLSSFDTDFIWHRSSWIVYSTELHECPWVETSNLDPL